MLLVGVCMMAPGGGTLVVGAVARTTFILLMLGDVEVMIMSSRLGE